MDQTCVYICVLAPPLPDLTKQVRGMSNLLISWQNHFSTDVGPVLVVQTLPAAVWLHPSPAAERWHQTARPDGVHWRMKQLPRRFTSLHCRLAPVC